MRVSIRHALAFAVLMAFSAPALLSAQSIPSPYSFIERKQETGPFFGVMNANTGRFGFGPKGGLVTGGRWGIELAGPLSFEGVVGFVNGDRDIVDPGRDEGVRVIGVGDVLMTTIDARLKFSLMGARAWNDLSPFIVFGGGAAFDVAGTAPMDADLLPADRFDFGTSFFGTLGGGTRWFLTERFGVRADGIFSIWKIGTPPGFSDPERTFEAVDESEWVSGFTFTVSGLIRW